MFVVLYIALNRVTKSFQAGLSNSRFARKAIYCSTTVKQVRSDATLRCILTAFQLLHYCEQFNDRNPHLEHWMSVVQYPAVWSRQLRVSSFTVHPGRPLLCILGALLKQQLWPLSVWGHLTGYVAGFSSWLWFPNGTRAPIRDADPTVWSPLPNLWRTTKTKLMLILY